jgi:hypothetical protein
MATIKTSQLQRIYSTIDYLSNLEGQDMTLVVELNLCMINAVIEGDTMVSTLELVKRYCDVIDSEADAMRIAEEIGF